MFHRGNPRRHNRNWLVPTARNRATANCPNYLNHEFWNRNAVFYMLLLLCLFVGIYKVELFDPRTGGFMPSSPGIGMHVEVRDPDDKAILSKVYSSEGRFTFTSHIPGEHVICLYSNSTKWFAGSQLVCLNLSSISEYYFLFSYVSLNVTLGCPFRGYISIFK